MKVFLSHPSRLKSTLREIRRNLPKFLDTWLDEDRLCWGDDLEPAIRHAISSGSDFVVIFLDRHALESSWVQSELDWALKRETEIGRTFVLPIAVESFATEALPEALRGRLNLRLADYMEQSVSNLASQISNHLFQLIVRSFDQATEKSPHHDKPNFAEKVAALATILDRHQFRPDIIVGIPRGGLVVAAMLSKSIDRDGVIPIISLWPRPGFDNPLNNGAAAVRTIRPLSKILVVDDICRSGRTLSQARTYLEESIDLPAIGLKTAAVTHYEGAYSGAIRPDYFVEQINEAIRDFGGDVEPRR